MLLTVKSLVEGSRLLALHAATLIDVAHHAEDAAERERADTLVSFLTPISKACQTEWGIENTYNALQCFGGHGYIREHGMEQLARDARITTLYEGTTGIQALDLIVRKTASSQGAGLKLMLAEIEAFAKEHEGNEALAEFIGPLRAKAAEWGKLTMDVLQRAVPIRTNWAQQATTTCSIRVTWCWPTGGPAASPPPTPAHTAPLSPRASARLRGSTSPVCCRARSATPPRSSPAPPR